jgi:hypothetical protein
MKASKAKQAELLGKLKDTVSGFTEPDIAGMFENLRNAKTLGAFKEALTEIAEFTDELQSNLEDLKNELEEEDEDEDEDESPRVDAGRERFGSDY